ncbi:DnaJ protein-like protein 1 [Aphelenchoides avenae]|nr:DnaJ protein-like protein 1 [Aphelenchus avenae]
MWLPPGCLAGTEREFELDDGSAITLVVRDKPHKDFRREGSDLHHTHRLPLRDALLGAVVNIHSFTGELVKLGFDQPIPHGSVKRQVT